MTRQELCEIEQHINLSQIAKHTGFRAHHADDGARGDVLDEVREEGLGGQVLIVLLRHGAVRHRQLQRRQPEALALKARDDLRRGAAADSRMWREDSPPNRSASTTTLMHNMLLLPFADGWTAVDERVSAGASIPDSSGSRS